MLQRVLRYCLVLHLIGNLCIFFQGHPRERKGEGSLLSYAEAPQQALQRLPRELRFITMAYPHMSTMCTLLANTAC